MRSIEINNEKERIEAHNLFKKYTALAAALKENTFPRVVTLTAYALIGPAVLGATFVSDGESALPGGIISCLVCFGISSGIGLVQLMKYLQFKEVDNEITRRSMIAHKKLLSVETKNNDEEKQSLQ